MDNPAPSPFQAAVSLILPAPSAFQAITIRRNPAPSAFQAFSPGNALHLAPFRHGY